MLLKPERIPVGVYIHIPWCIKKCLYCDFNAHEKKDPPYEAYADNLISDFETDLPLINNRLISSIFIGGGTPSLMPPKILEKVIKFIINKGKISKNVEITLEANPGTLDQSYLSDFKTIGINRLSLGLQSFDDQCLSKLGRAHNGKMALQTLKQAISLDFDSINVDLMHGIPEQTRSSAKNDIEIVLGNGVKHISWYSLTIEPNTYFFSKPPVLPDISIKEDIDIVGEKILKKSGLRHYEISSFAMKNSECKHNTNVWKFGDYLGLGAGAHGKVTTDYTIKRSIRTRHPKHYLSRNNSNAEWRIIGTEEAILECLLNGLRLAKGISHSMFTSRSGSHADWVREKFKNEFRNKIYKNRFQTTQTGWRFLDDFLVSLV